MAPKGRRRSLTTTDDAVQAMNISEEARLRREIIEEMDRNPGKIRRLHPIAMGAAILQDRPAGETEVATYYHPTLVKLSGIPKKDMAMILASLDGQRFSGANLDNANEHNRHCILQMFHFALGTHAGFPWPAGEAHNKEMFRNMCHAIMRACGRHTRITIIPSGASSITENGVFKFFPDGQDEEQYTHIQHVDSGTQVTCYQQH